MQDGKALQAGTSHYLGTNFSKAMGIEFTDAEGKDRLAHTTSWGTSTRLMGALVMTHADDNGLRLPPRVAPQQVQIVPITRDDPAKVNDAAEELAAELRKLGALGAPLRVSVDLRDRKPAEKRWEWIRKGAPVVVELGERDIDSGVVTTTRRNDPDLGREQLDRDGAAEKIVAIVDAMQGEFFAEAAERMAARTATDIAHVDAFRDYFSGDDTDSGGFVRAPWSQDPDTEKTMGELGVSVRCIPFEQNLAEGAACVISGAPAKVEAVFAKAY